MTSKTPTRDGADGTADARRRRSPAAAALPSPLSPGTVRALEEVETAAWTDLYAGAPEPIKGEAGLGLRRVGGLAAACAAAFDVLALNRVIGRQPGTVLDGELLERLMVHYRGRGVRRAFLPWPPPPPGARAWLELEQRGIRPYNRWMKLWRDTSPPPPVASALAAGPLDVGGRQVFEEVLAQAFDWPPPIPRLWSSLIGRPGWRHFAAREGGRVVAVAGLLLGGSAAWLGPAATRPAHRGAGAQKLLIRERIAAARAAGCRLLAVETAEPAAERPVPSFDNLRRMGFEVAYRRENYLIHLDDERELEENPS